MSQNVKPQTLHQTSPDRSSSCANSTPIAAMGAAENPANSQFQAVPSLATKMDVDALLDNVFGDIERMLERGSSLARPLTEDSTPDPSTAIAPFSVTPQSPDPTPTGATATPAITSELATSEAAASETTPFVNSLSATLSFPSNSSNSLALLPKLSPRQLKREDPIAIDQDEFDLFSNALEVSEPSPSRPVDWLLLALALISLISAAGLWIFVRLKLPQLTQATNVPSAEEVLQAKHDTEFLGYVRRSLERIDRVGKQTKPATDPRTTTALDPLFVPLPPPPPIASAPPVAAAPRIVVSPLATAPVAPPVASSMPSLPPTPPPDSIAVASIPATPSIPNIAPSPTHTLIGLLELGDRSAALFEIDGAPQRIQVGEKFGASGWTLISVAGDEAIVRRNEDVRSVFIGQKF